MAKLSVRQWKVVSLFAGIGGIDLAFEQVGFQIIWANEIDRFACQTYRANFPNHKLVEGDIRKIDVKDISPHDILTAGFPCQPFSLAQSDKDKKGLKHKSGNLFLEIVRVLEYHKPSMFLLENVKGLTFKNNKEVFDIILNSLKDLGYYVKWEILGAHTHGNIPQSRNRVFIIGFRDKERFDSFEFPKPIPLTTKLSEVIDFSLEQEDKYYYSPSKHKFYSQLKEGIEQEERERERERETTYQWRRSYVKTHKNNLSFTLCGYLPWVPIIMSKKNQKENKQVVFTETRKRGIIGTISEKVVPTLRVGMGTGGGNIPMIFQIRGGKWMTREYKETSPTLTTNPQHVPYKYTLSEKGWSGMLERQKKGQGEGFGLVNSNTSHTRTLKARYYKDGAEVLVEQKENRPRKLTPRECANLQGFPKDFKIVCSDSQAYKQFGNSVCVPLIKKIALRIQNVLKL